jgi:sugar phosphate isomerase/epimerase
MQLHHRLHLRHFRRPRDLLREIISVPATLATLPLSVAHLSELEVPPPQLIEFSARAGFASVGLRVSPAVPGGINYPLRSDAERADMRRRMKATGVSVLYVELISLSRATKAADHIPLLETGAALGATRLAVAGDDADFAIVAERMAEICDLAKTYGIAVDLEFMPFRAVRSLADAAKVVRLAKRPNAHILLDALHFYRSGSTIAELAGIDPFMLGTFQICDAPRAAPPPDGLATEARVRRLLPGDGGLDLRALVDALPQGIPFGVETPVAGQFPHLDPQARLTMMVSRTREFLAARRAA